MVLELATVLLGAFIGAIAVLYAAPKGYFGHPRKRGSGSATSIESYSQATEQAVEVPAAVAPTVAEPVPFSAPPMYETVQPAPAPVMYPSSSVASFGSSASKKPTRTYRRRAAPVRSTAGAKASMKAKAKKR